MADTTALKASARKDDDLDELLDSALEDFDKTSKPQIAKAVSQTSTSKDKTDTQPIPHPVKTVGEPTTASSTDAQEDELNKLFAQSFAEAAVDLEKSMKTMMGDGDQDFMAHLNQLAQAASSAAKQENPDSMKTFENNLSRTLSELSQNTKDMESVDPMGEDVLKAMMSGMGLSEGGDLDMIPMMQNMMKNLLSKDILYPSLKEMNDKFPCWLDEKKSSISREEHARFTKQYELVSKICQEYEAEKEDDSDDEKKKRLERIMDLMHKMQECGQPPEELLGQMASGAPFATDPTAPMPSMPPMPELPTDLQEQCKVS